MVSAAFIKPDEKHFETVVEQTRAGKDAEERL